MGIFAQLLFQRISSDMALMEEGIKWIQVVSYGWKLLHLGRLKKKAILEV
jgi:hypothetical protein